MTAIKMFLLSKQGKKVILSVIFSIVILISVSCGMCSYKVTQISIQEVINYFRPTMVIKILPKLTSNSYKEKIMYATYFELFLSKYENDKNTRNITIQKIIDSEFYFDPASDSYTAELDDNVFFDNVESQLLIEIDDNQRQKIVETANKIDLTNNAMELADFALSQLNNHYTSYTSYEPINGEWDSTFISYCCEQLGYIEAGYYKKHTDRNTALSECRRTGKFQDGYAYGNEYVPFPGDIIFLNRDCENSTSDQMGIVTKIEGTVITMVVGDGGQNWSGSSVALRRYEYNSSYIVGYYPISNYINKSILEEEK